MTTALNIKGEELPVEILEKLNATPFHTFKITPATEIEYDDEGNPMPPEECFSDELIKAVEESERDIKEGRFQTFDSVDEMFEELNK